MVLARAARAGVALALLTALAAAQSPAPEVEPENLPPTAPGLAPYFNKPKVNVCVCEVLPYVKCSNETAPSSWTGYDLELFKRAMPYMGWKDSMINWKCITWPEITEDIYGPEPWAFPGGKGVECDIAPVPAAYNEASVLAGVKYTVPTMRAGYIVMTARIEKTPSIWYFFSAMSTQVWIILVITAILTGIVVWMYEIGMQALNHDTRWLSNVMWDTLGRPVEMRDYRLSSNAANVLAFAWSFLVFILFALYTANLTANLTVTQLQNDIKGLSDLPGQVVGAPSWIAEDYLPKYNIKAVPYEWDGTPENSMGMIDAVTNGTLKALILDANILRSIDAQNCNTMLVGAEFDIGDSGPMFPPPTPDSIVEAYDLALLQLQKATVFEEMYKRYINPKPASCKSSDVETETSSVTWQEAAGLWVILGVGAGIGLLLVGNHWLMKWAVPRLRKQPWFYRCCPCANPRSTITRSYTAAVSIGGFTRTPRVPAAGDKGELMDELWDDRYAGASEGYLDGSADIAMRDHGHGHSGPGGKASARSMKKFNDSANRGELDVVGAGNKTNNGALRLILNELSSMRAQIASLQGTRAPAQLEPMDSHRVRFAEDA